MKKNIIIENIKNYIKYKKDLREGNKQNLLNSPVELMNKEDLKNELEFLLKKNKDSQKLDERTVELVKEILSYSKEYFDFDKYNVAMNLICYLSKSTAQKQLLEIYSDLRVFPREILDKLAYDSILYFSPTGEQKVEDAINRLKMNINRFTDIITRPFRKQKTDDNQGIFYSKYKRNPLELKMSYKIQNESRQKNEFFRDFIKANIFMNNIDKIDLEKFFDSAPLQLIDNIINSISDEQKSDFLKMYFSSKCFKEKRHFGMDDFIKKYKEFLPTDDLILSCIDLEIDKNTIEDIDISDSAILEYYKIHGCVPFKFREKLDSAVNNMSFEDICIFLEHVDDKISIYTIVKNLSNEEYEKIKDNEKISDDIKEKIYRIRLHSLSDEEKLSEYSELSVEKQKKLQTDFIIGSLENDEFLSSLINLTKDENFRDLLKIQYLKKENNLEEIIDYINHCKEYGLDFENSKLMQFKDEEIAEIYDKITDENIKNQILRFNRKINMFSEEAETMTDEEIKEYNKAQPNSVLVNNSNILNFLDSAKTTERYSILINLCDFDEFSFEEKYKILNDYINKKDSLTVSYYSFEEVKNDIIRVVSAKTNFKEAYLLLQNGFIDNKYFLGVMNEKYRNTNIENVIDELAFIENIEDIKLKKEMLSLLRDRLINTYYYGDNMSEKKKNEDNNSKNYKILNDIYKQKILDDKVSTENKYLYLACLLENYNSREMSPMNKKISLERAMDIKDLFAIINKQEGKEEYNTIYNFEPQYRESVFGGEFFQNSYFNYIECLPYLASDKVYSLLKKLYENNNDVTNNINPLLLEKNIIDTVEYDIIEYLSRYGFGLNSKYDKNELSDLKLETFCKTYTNLKEIKAFPEEYTVNLMKVINSLSDEELSKIDFNEKLNIDLLMFLAINKESFSDMQTIKPTEKESVFELYKNKIKEDARAEIHSKLLNRRTALDAIGKRFFNYSYNQMYDLKEKYGTDYKIYLNRLLDKRENQELSLMEENELKALLIFRNIDELLEIKDTQALVRVFEELDKEKEYEECDFLAMTTLDEEMKRIYSKDMIDKAYSPKENDKIKQIDGIDIYSPKKFNIFVHVVGAFGDYKLVDENTSAKEIWNSPNKKRNHILCTSYIGNRNMCYVRRDTDKNREENEVVILGFGKETNSYITMASKTDIGSDTEDISSEKSGLLSIYRTAENIIRCCRHGHNEIDFERRRTDNKVNNIEPEYIVCFDEINDYSKKVAKDFGIPIVLIDKREVAKNQSEELNEKINKFKKDKEPNLLGDIINLYQCARHAFLVGKKDLALAEEFFNPEEFNRELNEIIEIIEKEKKFGQKKNADNCYLALFQALDEEMKLCKEEYKDIDSFSDYRTNLRELRFNLKQKINIENIENESKKIDENIIINPMYNKIANERKIEDVTK